MDLEKHIKYSYSENVKYFYGEKDRRTKIIKVFSSRFRNGIHELNMKSRERINEKSFRCISNVSYTQKNRYYIMI